MSAAFGMSVFHYPTTRHVRRHGPHGYEDYKSYKPWLRDEFTFRCVFCLVRERWCHDGPNGFGVDHLIPKTVRPDLICDYENLLYLCNRCNSAKRLSAVLDPCSHALGDHLQVSEDGTIVAITKEGEHVIDAFNLNYASAKAFRKRKIDSLVHWQETDDTWSITSDLAFPDELPQLDDRRCANSRPEGVSDCFYAQRNRGTLPTSY
jgi:hypothetical protein